MFGATALVGVTGIVTPGEMSGPASYVMVQMQPRGGTAMTGSGKSLKDLAGSSLGFRTSNALERAMETQRSIDKLTALGAFGDDAISRAARGL